MKVAGRCLLAFAMGALLVGCEKRVDDAEVSALPQAVAHKEVAPEECSKAFYSPMEGFDVVYAFHFRADKLYVGRGGPRRGIFLEYLSGDPRSVFDDTVKALEAMGYKARGVATTSTDGEISQSLSGQGGAYLEVTPEVGGYPSNPAAKGVVSVSWPIKSLAEPARPGD